MAQIRIVLLDSFNIHMCICWHSVNGLMHANGKEIKVKLLVLKVSGRYSCSLTIIVVDIVISVFCFSVVVVVIVGMRIRGTHTYSCEFFHSQRI